MKKAFILVCALAVAAGCGAEKRRFTVLTDPPDAEIIVLTPKGTEQKFSSPAEVVMQIPGDPDLAAKSRMEVRRDKYKTKIISLANIDDGQEVRVKLEKVIHYLVKVSLLSPQQSGDLRYRDRVLAAAFDVQDRQLGVTLQNFSPKPLKILWEQSSYTDYVNHQHRIMHSGVRPQDRNNAIPPQVIQPGESVKLEIMPVSFVSFSQAKKAYENKMLFPLDSDLYAQALKGRFFYLFLPVEMDRQIIPYNFKFQIVDTIKES